MSNLMTASPPLLPLIIPSLCLQFTMRCRLTRGHQWQCALEWHPRQECPIWRTACIKGRTLGHMGMNTSDKYKIEESRLCLKGANEPACSPLLIDLRHNHNTSRISQWFSTKNQQGGFLWYTLYCVIGWQRRNVARLRCHVTGRVLKQPRLNRQLWPLTGNSIAIQTNLECLIWHDMTFNWEKRWGGCVY